MTSDKEKELNGWIADAEELLKAAPVGALRRSTQHLARVRKIRQAIECPPDQVDCIICFAKIHDADLKGGFRIFGNWSGAEEELLALQGYLDAMLELERLAQAEKEGSKIH